LNLDETHSQTALIAQVSSTSTPTTIGSVSSATTFNTTPAMVDITSPVLLSRLDETVNSDVEAEDSEEEGFEPVAPPPTTQYITRTPPPSAFSHESATTTNTGNAETCFDPTTTGHTQLTSPLMTSKINPFEQLHLRQQQRNAQINEIISAENIPQEMSPCVSSPQPAISSPVDLRSLLAYESNRLETFRKQNREIFGQVSVAHLAYVGFYLNGEGTLIQCPWCEVQLNERQFEEIMRIRPSVVRSSISDEPWTPMRVHRHANGMIMDQNHHWCTWVRREAGGLHPNVTMVCPRKKSQTMNLFFFVFYLG